MSAPPRKAATRTQTKTRHRVRTDDFRPPRYPYLPCGYEAERREEYLAWLEQAEEGGDTKTPDSCEERFATLLGVWTGFTLTNPIDWFPVYEDVKAGDIAVLRLSDSYAPDWVRDGRTVGVHVPPDAYTGEMLPSPTLPRGNDLDRLIESASAVLEPPMDPPDESEEGRKETRYRLPPHEVFAESATVFGLGPIGLGLVTTDAELDPDDGYHHAQVGMFLPFPVELLDSLLDPSRHGGDWFEGFATTERDGLACPIQTSVPEREGKGGLSYLTESQFRRFVYWIGEEFDPDGWFSERLVLLEEAAEGIRGGTVVRSVPKDEPWDRFSANHQPGDILEGTISRVLDWGIFVEFEVDDSEITGVIHVSNLSDREVEHPQDVVELGQVIEVRILSIDTLNQRLGLTMRKLEVDEESDHGPLINWGTWRLKSPAGAAGMMSLWSMGMLRLSDRERGIHGLARLAKREDLGPGARRLGYSLERFRRETEAAACEAAEALLSVNLTGALPDRRFPRGGTVLVSIAPHQAESVLRACSGIERGPVLPYKVEADAHEPPSEPAAPELEGLVRELSEEQRNTYLWHRRRPFDWRAVHDDLGQIYLSWMRGVLAKNPHSPPGILTVPIHGGFDEELKDAFWELWSNVESGKAWEEDEDLVGIANQVLLTETNSTDLSLRPYTQLVYPAWWNNPRHWGCETRLVPIDARIALACWEATFSLVGEPLRYSVAEPLYFPDRELRPDWLDNLSRGTGGMDNQQLLDHLYPSSKTVSNGLNSLLRALMEEESFFFQTEAGGRSK